MPERIRHLSLYAAGAHNLSAELLAPFAEYIAAHYSMYTEPYHKGERVDELEYTVSDGYIDSPDAWFGDKRFQSVVYESAREQTFAQFMAEKQAREDEYLNLHNQHTVEETPATLAELVSAVDETAAHNKAIDEAVAILAKVGLKGNGRDIFTVNRIIVDLKAMKRQIDD